MLSDEKQSVILKKFCFIQEHVEPEFLDYDDIIKTEPKFDEQNFDDNIDSETLTIRSEISVKALPVINPKRSDTNAVIQKVRSSHYICAICDQIFQSKKLLQKHFRSHGFKVIHLTHTQSYYYIIFKLICLQPYTCNICTNSFGSRTTYYRHNRLNHRSVPPSRYMCTWPYCDKSYRHKQTLVKHVDTAHFDKPQKQFLKPKPISTIPSYECNICGKVRYRKHRILGHLRQHMGLKVNSYFITLSIESN